MAVALAVLGLRDARFDDRRAPRVHGFVFGFLRIAWIIIASIFLYNVAVETGQFQVMKDSIAALSSDRRLQAVLIAFCFGAFLEGTGGGGAPVAIAGSFLIGLGFPPFQAATVCLLANTAPVAWGGVGNPIRVLAGVTGLPEHALNAMTGRILPPFSFILPLWLVRSMVRLEADVRSAARAARRGRLVRGDAVLLVELRGDEPRGHRVRGLLAAGDGGLPALLAPEDRDGDRRRRPRGGDPAATRSGAVLKGWSPFVVASILIFLWALPAFGKYIKFAALTLPHAGPPQPRHPHCRRWCPRPRPRAPLIDLNVLALPGTAVFAGAFLAAPFLGMSLTRGLADPRPGPSASSSRRMLAISFMVGPRVRDASTRAWTPSSA